QHPTPPLFAPAPSAAPIRNGCGNSTPPVKLFFHEWPPASGHRASSARRKTTTPKKCGHWCLIQEKCSATEHGQTSATPATLCETLAHVARQVVRANARQQAPPSHF